MRIKRNRKELREIVETYYNELLWVLDMVSTYLIMVILHFLLWMLIMENVPYDGKG